MLLQQGNTYQLPVNIKIDNERLTGEDVSHVEITFDSNGSLITKNYPEEVTFQNGAFIVPLSQEDTFALQGICRYQVRVLFPDGEVRGSGIKTGAVADSISKVVLK